MATDIKTDTGTDQILLAASNHDLDALKQLLQEPGAANAQDPDTGFAPLHAAIAACAPDDDLEGEVGTNGTGDAVHGNALSEEAALATIKLLFENGAIWNELDTDDETPGCIARRLGLNQVYEAIVEAGVRAELLFNRLDDYEPIPDVESGEDDHDDDKIEGFEPVPDSRTSQVTNGAVQEPIEGFEPLPNPSDRPAASATRPAPVLHAEQVGSSVPVLTHGNSGQGTLQQSVQESIQESAPGSGQQSGQGSSQETQSMQPALKNPNVNSEDYLASELTYSGDRLLDSDKNAVMMDWETEIMYKSVEKTVPKPGLRTMNVGFGMGIVDEAFLAKDPAMHHIIEAHPLVMSRMKERGWYDKPNVTVHEGKWQEVLPRLVEEGVVLDAIYFDTYAEDYKDLKAFFQDFVIGLLDSNGLFGFYNGLGADRQICYDVYTKVRQPFASPASLLCIVTDNA